MSRQSEVKIRYACDVHTHTLYSRHAYSTVEENVHMASERAIELLGITDHFSDMLYETRDIRNYQHFTNMHSWPRTWCGVKLLHGCEADIVDLKGHLYGWDTTYTHNTVGTPIKSVTLQDNVFRNCDYVIASIHGKSFVSDASLADTTKMYIHALENPKVLILGHPGRAGVSFDISAVLSAARDLHKLIEINEHSFSDYFNAYSFCYKIAEGCAEMEVPIAVNSDAHISYDIGRFHLVSKLLDEIEFPPRLIATRSADAFLSALSLAGLDPYS